MTIFLFYLLGMILAVAFNYALHQPNKEIEERLEKLEKKLYED